ncbi:MAG: CoA transferase, partial [Acidimicrobiia bacterium]
MLALEGLRVIDLSPTPVGAQVSQLFADFGAEVIWVEPPHGSALRQQTSFPFLARGKQSVVIDLSTAAGQDQLRALAATADVLVETFRPGVMEEWGIGYDSLAAHNPRLVYASITGFGTKGPYANVKGYEGIVQAKLGVFHAFRRMKPDKTPPFVAVPWASFSASQTALQGILAALYEREHSGAGQKVEASLLQGFMALDTWEWTLRVITTKWPEGFKSSETFDADGFPLSPLTYMLLIGLTKDGHWLQFAQVAPRLFLAEMKAMGLAWMLTDPEWKGIPAFEDADRRRRMWELMLEATRSKTLAEWEAIFDADPDVFAEQFRRGPAVLEHPQMIHDHQVADLVDAERGPVHQPGAMVQMDLSPGDVTRSAPRLGEHDPSVLASRAPATSTPVVTDAPRRLPLEGVTIIELAVMFAAPYGSTLLTDLGARVIKVEPLDGDPIRTIIPFPESGGAKVMQGKDSICVDLAKPEGLAIVQELAKTADIVFQGYRAGAAARAGVDAQSLRTFNPDLIYLNAPGYGTGGPHGHRPAYAPSIGAAGGIARANVGGLVDERDDLTMEQIQDGARRLSGGGTITNAQADGIAALGVGTALVLGLLARQRGAGAQEMLTTMLSTAAHALHPETIDYPGCPPHPEADLALRGFNALYRIYDAADGWVFLA